ncbi:MAG: hypothetical protein JXA42_12670 [Anaerolineales bacterium]|nr:hypothetical protein [Anaerolineales bacterium]
MKEKEPANAGSFLFVRLIEFNRIQKFFADPITVRLKIGVAPERRKCEMRLCLVSSYRSCRQDAVGTDFRPAIAG